MKVVKWISKFCFVVLGSILSLIVLVWISWNIAKCFLYSDYYQQRENVSKIPGLNDGFVPQGLDYDEETDIYIHSGYNGAYIELYLVKGTKTKKLIPVNEDGEREKGHASGVACAGNYLYVCDNDNEGADRVGLLRIFNFNEILMAEDGAEIKPIQTFEVDTSSFFCYSDDHYIYVGEFYRAVDYETSESHYYTTPAGDENKALLSAYPLHKDGSIIGEDPEFFISIPAQVQGFAITQEGKIALSISWGLASSHLEFHSGKKDSGKTISVSGKEVPLYYIDSATKEKDVVIPAFSEGLSILDDKVIISFESASNKYLVGKFFFANKVAAFPIN